MKALSPELKTQIDEEAEKYGFRVPYDGSTDYYNEDRVKGYQDGAKAYAAKWYEAEEKAAKLLIALKKIINSYEDKQTPTQDRSTTVDE